MCCCVAIVVFINRKLMYRHIFPSPDWQDRSACIDDMFSHFDPPLTGEIANVLPGYDNLFVVHYNKLTKRRAALEDLLVTVGLQDVAIWVDWLNKDDIVVSDTSAFHRCVDILGYDEGVHAALMSLNLKHMWIYWYTVRHKLQKVLVMEDDPLFRQNTNIVDKLTQLVKEIPDDYWIVYVGECPDYNHSVYSWKLPDGRLGSRVFNTSLFGPGYPSRCTGGYVISEQGARNMLKFISDKGVTKDADMLQEEVLTPGSFWNEQPLWSQTDLGGVSHEWFLEKRKSHRVADEFQAERAYYVNRK